MEELAEARRVNRRESPGAVVRLGLQQLGSPFLRGPEQWSVREQVLVAALDAGEGEVAARLLVELEAQFPGSLRVARLRGLVLEAAGKSKEAAAVYDEMIKSNPNGALGFKRKVCLLKSAGRLPEAIKSLSAFLEVFQSEEEAWKELAQLYVEAGDLAGACFCLEEVLLHRPHSYLAHMAYGEALMTLGGDLARLHDARKYLCSSLVKKPAEQGNCRALWGLAVATCAMQTAAERARDKDKDNKKGAPASGSGGNKQQIVAAQGPAEPFDDATNKRISAKALDELANVQYCDKGMEEIVKATLRRLAIA
jgi:predicted Zn-dependent protease